MARLNIDVVNETIKSHFRLLTPAGSCNLGNGNEFKCNEFLVAGAGSLAATQVVGFVSSNPSNQRVDHQSDYQCQAA
jgi:hypothetical protein